MSRDIKFRVWNGSRYYYTRSGTVGFSSGPAPSLNFYWTDNIGFDMSLLGDGAMIVEQFTGILDKKGREIYEGDVIIQHGNRDIDGMHFVVGDISTHIPLTPIGTSYETALGHYNQINKWIGSSEVFYEVINNIHEYPCKLT